MFSIVPADDVIRGIVHPRDPRDRNKYLSVGFCYGDARRPGSGYWALYARNEKDVYQFVRKCYADEIRRIEYLRELVWFVQTITEYPGVALIKAWEYKVRSPAVFEEDLQAAE